MTTALKVLMTTPTPSVVAKPRIGPEPYWYRTMHAKNVVTLASKIAENA